MKPKKVNVFDLNQVSKVINLTERAKTNYTIDTTGPKDTDSRHFLINKKKDKSDN